MRSYRKFIIGGLVTGTRRYPALPQPAPRPRAPHDTGRLSKQAVEILPDGEDGGLSSKDDNPLPMRGPDIQLGIPCSVMVSPELLGAER